MLATLDGHNSDPSLSNIKSCQSINRQYGMYHWVSTRSLNSHIQSLQTTTPHSLMQFKPWTFRFPGQYVSTLQCTTFGPHAHYYSIPNTPLVLNFITPQLYPPLHSLKILPHPLSTLCLFLGVLPNLISRPLHSPALLQTSLLTKKLPCLLLRANAQQEM